MGDPNRDSAWWVRGRNEISLHIAVKFISGTYSHERAGHQSRNKCLGMRASRSHVFLASCLRAVTIASLDAMFLCRTE